MWWRAVATYPSRASNAGLPRALPDSRPLIESRVRKAVIGRNLMGVAYFHTFYETLGSIAFALDLLQSDSGGGDSSEGGGEGEDRDHGQNGGAADGTDCVAGGTCVSALGAAYGNQSAMASASSPNMRVVNLRVAGGKHTGHESSTTPRVRLLENMCIPADGSQVFMNMRSRSCAGDGYFGNGACVTRVCHLPSHFPHRGRFLYDISPAISQDPRASSPPCSASWE